MSLTLAPVESRTRVEVVDHAIEGPTAALWNTLIEALTGLHQPGVVATPGGVGKTAPGSAGGGGYDIDMSGVIPPVAAGGWQLRAFKHCEPVP